MLKSIEGNFDHPEVNELLTKHFIELRAASPQGSAHVLDIPGLKVPSIKFWSLWENEKLLGCGALKFLNKEHGEFKSIRVHGKGSDKYDNVRIGLNGRLDTIQAAILLAKLEIFDDEIKSRNKIAEIYNSELSEFLTTPFVRPNNISAWAQYSVLAKNEKERKKIQTFLKDNGVPTAIYYPTPLHQQTAYKYLEQSGRNLKISEEVSKRIFSLPMHPYLDEKSIIKITNLIKKVLKK